MGSSSNVIVPLFVVVSRSRSSFRPLTTAIALNGKSQLLRELQLKSSRFCPILEGRRVPNCELSWWKPALGTSSGLFLGRSFRSSTQTYAGMNDDPPTFESTTIQ